MLDRILDIGIGYWKSQVLFTSYNLGIFELLPETLPALKLKLGVTHADQIKTLLNCLQKLELVKKMGDKYYCNFGHKKYEKYIKHLENLKPLFENLHENIMTGKASLRDHHDMDIQNLIEGLENISDKTLPVQVQGNILDVGAGTGFLSKLAAKIPEVENIYALEKPDMFKSLKEKTKDYSKIVCCSGDYLNFEFTRKFDFIFLSQVLHGRSPIDRESFAKKLLNDLKSGGKIIIREQLSGDYFGSFFGLNLLVCTGNGKALSFEDIEKLFPDCNVEFIYEKSGWISWISVTKVKI